MYIRDSMYMWVWLRHKSTKYSDWREPSSVKVNIYVVYVGLPVRVSIFQTHFSQQR